MNFRSDIPKAGDAGVVALDSDDTEGRWIPVELDEIEPARPVETVLSADVSPVAVEPGRLAAARTVVAEAATALRPRRVWLCGVCLLGMTFVNVGLGAWVNAFLEADQWVPAPAVTWLPALVGIGLLPASAAGAVAARGGR